MVYVVCVCVSSNLYRRDEVAANSHKYVMTVTQSIATTIPFKMFYEFLFWFHLSLTHSLTTLMRVCLPVCLPACLPFPLISLLRLPVPQTNAIDHRTSFTFDTVFSNWAASRFANWTDTVATVPSIRQPDQMNRWYHASIGPCERQSAISLASNTAIQMTMSSI